MKRRLTITGLIVLFLFCSNLKAQHYSKRQINIQKALLELIDTNDVPGINLSIIYKNGRAENYFSGYAILKIANH